MASAINAPRIMIATLERVFVILRLLLERDLREQGLGIAHCQALTGITSHYRRRAVTSAASGPGTVFESELLELQVWRLAFARLRRVGSES